MNSTVNAKVGSSFTSCFIDFNSLYMLTQNPTLAETVSFISFNSNNLIFKPEIETEVNNLQALIQKLNVK